MESRGKGSRGRLWDWEKEQRKKWLKLNYWPEKIIFSPSAVGVAESTLDSDSQRMRTSLSCINLVASNHWNSGSCQNDSYVGQSVSHPSLRHCSSHRLGCRTCRSVFALHWDSAEELAAGSAFHWRNYDDSGRGSLKYPAWTLIESDDICLKMDPLRNRQEQ